MVLPLYKKIQVLSGITSCRLMEDNKLQVDFIDLLMNDMQRMLWIIRTTLTYNVQFGQF